MKETSQATKDFNKFLKKIGGLNNGYFERYHGKNLIKKFLFSLTAYILYKLPYYEKSKTFSKESGVMIFLYNILYWIFKPILRDNKPRNPFRSNICSRYYCEVGDGWLPLIQSCIEEAIDRGWNKEVCQVKEKFGSLRFYINGASSEVHDIIRKYENLSYITCEECGEPGKEIQGGWIRTLCDKCFKSNK